MGTVVLPTRRVVPLDTQPFALGALHLADIAHGAEIAIE